MTGPALGRVRILDLTHYMAGPYGTMLLAHLGAEVIKIEDPGSGDPMRQAMFHVQDGMSALFVSGNVSKKSLTLSLRCSEGRRIFLDLVRRSDAVMENWRPGALARLGLGWDDLRAANPRIVLASVSGFGQTGPWRDWAAFDLVAQAAGGGMSITGEPGRQPVKAGIAIGDLAAGAFAALGLLAALHRQRETGEGEWVDVSMMDAQLSLLNYVAHRYWASGEVPGAEAAYSPHVVPYQTFATATGPLAVAAYGDHFWPRFCRAVELPELAADPRFETNGLRVQHRDVLVPILEARIAERPREVWLPRLAAEGVPAGPVHRVDEALASPQARARDMVVELEGPSGAPLRVLGTPFKFQASGAALTPPPALGQHTADILRGVLGLDDAAIDALRSQGIV